MGRGSRVIQCKNNTKQWAYLAAVLVLSSKVLQAALVSTGIFLCVCVWGGGGGGSRVFQCKSNTKQWAYLAAVLVLSSKVLQAALVSTGIFCVCVCVGVVGGGGGGGGSRVFQCKNNTKQWAYLAAVLVLSSKVLQAALVSTGIFLCVCVWG